MSQTLNQDPITVILGAKGFIGGRLMRELQKMGKRVIGVANTGGSSIVTPQEILSDDRGFVDQIQLLVNAARSRNSLELKDSPLRLLEALEHRTQRLLNFSTYTQFCPHEMSAGLHQYIEEKKMISQFIKSSNYSAKSVDLALFTVIGEGDNTESFFSQLVRSKIFVNELNATSGDQLISYTDIVDVVSCFHKLQATWNQKVGSQYSFWPNPPLKLKTYIEYVDNYFSNNNKRTRVGALQYSGHELFDVSQANFPPQIFPHFEWTRFSQTLDRLTSLKIVQ